jgi:hypothetical protein
MGVVGVGKMLRKLLNTIEQLRHGERVSNFDRHRQRTNLFLVSIIGSPTNGTKTPEITGFSRRSLQQTFVDTFIVPSLVKDCPRSVR